MATYSTSVLGSLIFPVKRGFEFVVAMLSGCNENLSPITLRLIQPKSWHVFMSHQVSKTHKMTIFLSLESVLHGFRDMVKFEGGGEVNSHSKPEVDFECCILH